MLDSLQWKESDNRLFPGEKLYCEGRLKPALRGKIHGFGASVLCPLWLYIAYPKIDSTLELFAIGTYVIGTFACWCCSALYHCLSWDVNAEIFMQRLDHCLIFICISSTYTALASLAMTIENALLIYATLLITWIFSFCGIWSLFYTRGHLMIKLCVTNVILMIPSFPILSSSLTSFEVLCGITAIAFYAFGGYTFAYKVLDLLPNFFGYHEVFHSCTIMATFCTFLLYFSLIQERSYRCDINTPIFAFDICHQN